MRAGQVIEQSPDADDYVDPGTEVDLVVSLGKPDKAVPSVVNSLRKEAVSILRGDGFKVEQIERESDEHQEHRHRAGPARPAP